MSKTIFTVFCLVIASSAIHLNLNHENQFMKGVVTIKGSNGKYLQSCSTKGKLIAVNGLGPESDCQRWHVSRSGQSFVFTSLWKDADISICQNCVPQKEIVYFGYENNQWIPEQLQNGKWSFRGENGKYLSFQSGEFKNVPLKLSSNRKDVKFQNLAVISSSRPTEDVNAQWEVHWQ